MPHHFFSWAHNTWRNMFFFSLYLFFMYYLLWILLNDVVKLHFWMAFWHWSVCSGCVMKWTQLWGGNLYNIPYTHWNAFVKRKIYNYVMEKMCRLTTRTAWVTVPICHRHKYVHYLVWCGLSILLGKRMIYKTSKAARDNTQTVTRPLKADKRITRAYRRPSAGVESSSQVKTTFLTAEQRRSMFFFVQQ